MLAQILVRMHRKFGISTSAAHSIEACYLRAYTFESLVNILEVFKVQTPQKMTFLFFVFCSALVPANLAKVACSN